MIVRPMPGELWLFDQWEHCSISGELADAWGAPPFSEVPASVRRAAAIHDIGWRDWDLRPRLDPQAGQPHSYARMPDDDYRGIWDRGLARAWGEGELVGLLVSLHGMRFFERKEQPGDRRLLERERERQNEALRSLGAGGDAENLPEPYATWHSWMFFWDGLSLFACEGWPAPWRSALPGPGDRMIDVRAERAVEERAGALIEVRPFPFREPLALRAEARVIPDRAYTSQHELDAAISAARREQVLWRVRHG